jgi:hypothetical protein
MELLGRGPGDRDAGPSLILAERLRGLTIAGVLAKIGMPAPAADGAAVRDAGAAGDR